MNICYIVGAGECGEINIRKNDGDFVICADGGLAAAQRSKIVPDLIVGDFDSFGEIPKGENVIVHPAEKDDTDSLLAINCGLERGYTRFILYGMLGGRLDHTYANIQHLAYLCGKGASGVLIGEKFCVTSVRNGSLSFDRRESGMISIFSFVPESTGVKIEGLKYEVNNFTLRSDFPMGVSNEFIGKESCISVDDGTLIVMWENKGYKSSIKKK